MKILRLILLATLAAVSALYTTAALGGDTTPDGALPDTSAASITTTASDLSLSSFFTDGWDEPWTKYQRGSGTPDMSLLRVQTNFLVQLARLDASLQFGRNSPRYSQGETATAIVEYALNRRFMPALYVNHQWLEGREAPDEDGSAGGIFTRFQLMEHRESSLALTLRMALPDRDLGEHLTVWSYALAGWHDLQSLALGRTGLYFHVQHELLAGPSPAGNTQNAATYDISLAHTWTSGDSALQHFTTFLEAYGRTLLDGEHDARTAFSLTPGFRFTLAHRHILMFGLDIPVTHARVDDGTCRFSWIANF